MLEKYLDKNNYKLADTIGTAIYQQIPAMYCLTGHNTNSKYGRKLSGLKRLPFGHLEIFGTDPRLHCVEEMIHTAEKYLIQVLKPGLTTSQ